MSESFHGSTFGPPPKVSVAKAGIDIGIQPQINFIEGSGVTITATDDEINDRVDVTIATNTTTLDGIYLRLDATNSPLTGNLTISKDNPEFFLTDTTGGKSYSFRSIANSLEFIDRTANIRRGLVDTNGDWWIGGTLSDSTGSGANVKIVGNSIGIKEGGASPQYYSIFQGGNQAADITYTLPTASAAGFLQNNGSGVLSWSYANIAGNLVPLTNNAYDLGEDTTPLHWRSGYFETSIKVGVMSSGAFYTLDTTNGLSMNDPADNYIETNYQGPINMLSGVVDGATAVAFQLTTKNSLTTAGSLLFRLTNLSTNRFSVNRSGLTTANSFTSTVATGTAPYAATSTTVNTNLNADMVDGLHSTDLAPVGSAFVTVGNDATLTGERALTGTLNQISITDGGANSSVILSLPQSIATSSAVQFGQLGIGVAVGGANLITLSADGVIGTTGGLTINLSNTVDKTLVLQNSGAGVANMTMDGNLTVGSSISFVSATHLGLIVQTGGAFGVAADDNDAGIFFSSVSSGSLEFRNTAGTVMFSQVAAGTTNLADFIRDVRARQFIADGDNAGVASTVSITGTSDLTANNIGIGTILMKGTTSRNSAGFAKIYIGTTAYYVPVFDAITG